MESSDDEQIIERGAALDIGKAEIVCCIRLPADGGRRVQEVSTHSTMATSLCEPANRLVGLGVEPRPARDGQTDTRIDCHLNPRVRRIGQARPDRLPDRVPRHADGRRRLVVRGVRDHEDCDRPLPVAGLRSWSALPLSGRQPAATTSDDNWKAVGR